MSTEISKTRKIAAWIMAGMLTALFLFSATGKTVFASRTNGGNEISRLAGYYRFG